MNRTINLPCYEMTVTLLVDDNGAPIGSGSIISNLKALLNSDLYVEDELLAANIDGIEALVLAHACAGINIETLEYIQGIETAVEAAFNS